MNNVKEIAEFLSKESFSPRRENQVLTYDPAGSGWCATRAYRMVIKPQYAMGQPHSFWYDLPYAVSSKDIMDTFREYEWPHKDCRRMVVFLDRQRKRMKK